MESNAKLKNVESPGWQIAHIHRSRSQSYTRQISNEMRLAYRSAITGVLHGERQGNEKHEQCGQVALSTLAMCREECIESWRRTWVGPCTRKEEEDKKRRQKEHQFRTTIGKRAAAKKMCAYDNESSSLPFCLFSNRFVKELRVQAGKPKSRALLV